MYLISSWRWLTVHWRAITFSCLSEPVLSPDTLDPWCCSAASGTPLVMSLWGWGKQDSTGQVSPHSLADLRLYFFIYALLCTHVMEMPAYLHLGRYFQLRCRWAQERGGWERASKNALTVSHFSSSELELLPSLLYLCRKLACERKSIIKHNTLSINDWIL